MDTIDGLRVFARVMETGSISAAASGLDMSKALASKYLAQLEARLGARLVNRTTRRLSPTEVGRAAYVRCRSILEAVEDMQATVSAEHGEPRGLLRAAAPRAFGEDMLMGAVAGFMARYPDVQVDIALEERLVDIVGEGFDVALRIGALQDSSLIARRITPYPYMICAAPAYLDRAGMPQVPGDLAQHAGIVIGTTVAPTGQWRFVIDGKTVQVPIPVRARVSTARAAATLVRAGLGIGLCLYSTVADDLAAGRLVRLLQPYDAYAQRSVYAVYPQGRHLPAKVRGFVDFLVWYFAKSG